jgi:hypothetical protein
MDQPTLSHRFRIIAFSTFDRDFGILQGLLPTFVEIDIGNEIPVTCPIPGTVRVC